MSFKRSFLLLSVLIVAGIAIFWIVRGSGGSDKGQGALKSKEIAALDLSKADAEVFKPYFALSDCAGEELEALGALAGLGFGESGDSNLSYSKREADGATITYHDLLVEYETGASHAFKAEQAIFHCAGMVQDGPSFDRLDLTNASISENDVTFSFGSLIVSHPDPETAANLVEGILGKSQANPIGSAGFRGVSMADISMATDGFEATLNSAAWGETRHDDNTGIADLLIDTLNASFESPERAEKMLITFNGMSARNLVLNNKAGQFVSPNDAVSSLLNGLTIYEKPYDEFIVDAVKIESVDFNLDFDGIEAKATETNDVVTVIQKLKPLTIKMGPNLKDNPAFATVYNYAETLGFETLSLYGGSVTTLDKASDTISVSDGQLVLEDGFTLNMEYSALGLNTMVNTLKTMSDYDQRADPMKPLNDLKLKAARITLEDQSITTKGMKLASELMGVSEENIKRMLPGLPLAAAFAAKNDLEAEIYSETTSAFASFVKNGGTLTLETNPPEPFSIGQLFGDNASEIDPKALGFSASQDNLPR